MRDPRLIEIEFLMDLELAGGGMICSRMRPDTSFAQIGARRTMYGLDPGRFRDLVLDLLLSGAIIGERSRTDSGGSFEPELLSERNVLTKDLTGGRPINVCVSHAGRVRLWNLRDALMRDPEGDPMGLLSKAAWERHLPLRLQWASADEPFSIIFLDLDHFKAVNDRYGHARGDDVLRATFELAKNLIGPRGQVYRYGGEEVGVLLPNHKPDSATEIAEQLRAAIESDVRASVPQLEAAQTASFGVGTFTSRIDPRVAIEFVDALLYEAKHAGRNRVVARLHQGP